MRSCFAVCAILRVVTMQNKNGSAYHDSTQTLFVVVKMGEHAVLALHPGSL